MKCCDQTGKTTLAVYLRAKCRRFAAVALRIALQGSLSNYLSLRTLQLGKFFDSLNEAASRGLVFTGIAIEIPGRIPYNESNYH